MSPHYQPKQKHYERDAARHHTPMPLSVLLAMAGCACLAMTTSCTNDMQKIRLFDRTNLPAQIVKDADMTYSEEGHIQMHLRAPVIYKYTEPEERSTYPKGIHITFHNSDGTTKCTLSALYAISWDLQNIMMARDSVVFIDFSTRDTCYLKDIIWNKGEHRLYSNHTIRSVNGQRVTIGDGFHSDDNFEDPKIFHQRGVLVWNDGA